MNKKVLLVGFDRYTDTAFIEENIKKLLRKGDIPIFALSLQSTIRNKMAEQLLYANRVLVDMCDMIYANRQIYITPGYTTDIIGYATLKNKEVIVVSSEEANNEQR